MSQASEAARARLAHMGQRQPTIEPVDAINRAKQTEGIPTADTNPLNPKGVATVGGQIVQGADTPYRPLPDALSKAARDSLEAVGLTTLERVSAVSDDELLALDGIGEATVKTLREADDAK